jgi:hypothetical protein
MHDNLTGFIQKLQKEPAHEGSFSFFGLMQTAGQRKYAENS